MPLRQAALILSTTMMIAYLWAASLVVGQAQAVAQPLGDTGTVVVLGKRLTGSTADEEFMVRIQRLDNVLSEAKRRRAIATGSARGSQISEAAFVASVLSHRKIELEELSQTTRENLRYVKVMAGDELPLGVITNRYHLARTALLAQQKGMNIILVPAEENWEWTWSNLSAVSREALLYWPTNWGW